MEKNKHLWKSLDVFSNASGIPLLLCPITFFCLHSELSEAPRRIAGRPLSLVPRLPIFHTSPLKRLKTWESQKQLKQWGDFEAESASCVHRIKKKYLKGGVGLKKKTYRLHQECIENCKEAKILKAAFVLSFNGSEMLS